MKKRDTNHARSRSRLATGDRLLLRANEWEFLFFETAKDKKGTPFEIAVIPDRPRQKNHHSALVQK